jgi:NhaP-type Na+/H+ or K+/H+ antiporter
MGLIPFKVSTYYFFLSTSQHTISFCQVIVQVVVGFIFILSGLLINISLKPILLGPEIKSKNFEESLARSDYQVFNHRRSILKRALAK